MKTKNIPRLACYLLLLFFIPFSEATAQAQQRELYELKIYHLANEEQENRIDSFLENAYIPALQEEGVEKVGVFKHWEGDSLFQKRIYVLIPYESAEQLVSTPEALEQNDDYLSAGNAYLNAAHDDAPYERIETIVMRAFKGMPQLGETSLTNPVEKRIYELRSYEGATEKYFYNKVEMFDEGEIDIFDRLGFNAVFYAEVVAGSRMPNLMYMTSFEDVAARDEHWESFGKDPEWGRMSSMEKYQNNVSGADIYLLRAAPYSGIK